MKLMINCFGFDCSRTVALIDAVNQDWSYHNFPQSEGLNEGEHWFCPECASGNVQVEKTEVAKTSGSLIFHDPKPLQLQLL